MWRTRYNARAREGTRWVFMVILQPLVPLVPLVPPIPPSLSYTLGHSLHFESHPFTVSLISRAYTPRRIDHYSKNFDSIALT